MSYDPSSIEPKWEKYWDKNKTHQTIENPAFTKQKRFYCLDMFPYPSGAGLHVGHPEGYTASDIISRYKRMNGYNVLHPMGWDAFGLPAENYAIKTGTHPNTSTKKNIKTFKRQIKRLGFSYDWDREINTTDPKYYKWTQWIFIKLFKKGLAYEANMPINWCSSCKTGLANEEVIDGKCSRCNTIVTRRALRQWMLKITAYADRLLKDLDKLDWSNSIKQMQKNWIGKSNGVEIDFKISDTDLSLKIFTTRADTLFGATYVVLAPEHPYAEKIATPEKKIIVKSYQEAAKTKSDLERSHLEKTKTGIFTGAYAINPVNNKKIPIWISDYVLISYGTGAIMAVPAHDQRDFEFAKKHQLPIIQVITNNKDNKPTDLKEAFPGEGYLINSEQFTGLTTKECKEKITEWLVTLSIGKKTVNYKLRDWVFSRQRYWGEPIPIVHCEKCGPVAIPEDQLPLKLPEVKNYHPTETGESPLANIKEWVNTTCPACKAPAKRETNTMPQWAGSCWYFLRYLDPNNNDNLASKEKINYWLPVDLYIGGAEHAVLHLLYSRFWYKFLYDIGVVSHDEPFAKLINQGLILAEDGQKMSKSLGNVINPDDIIAEYGADAMRLYEMFMGPLEMAKPWDTKGIVGIKRFLDKTWRSFEPINPKELLPDKKSELDLKKCLHKTIAKVTSDIEKLSFNTAISALMILVKEILSLRNKVSESVLLEIKNVFARLIAPFAPHLAEELWSILGNKHSIHLQKWPAYDQKFLQNEKFILIIQVNGKIRDKVEVNKNIPNKELEEIALARDKLTKHIENKNIKKVIVVPNKLINIVVSS